MSCLLDINMFSITKSVYYFVSYVMYTLNKWQVLFIVNDTILIKNNLIKLSIFLNKKLCK